jgi:hypothetical protein
MIAMTKSTWMSPPRVNEVSIPRSHMMIRITEIVYSIEKVVKSI